MAEQNADPIDVKQSGIQAEVRGLDGHVVVSRNAEPVEIRVGSSLERNDVIQTLGASAMVLVLADGRIVSLGHDQSFELTDDNLAAHTTTHPSDIDALQSAELEIEAITAALAAGKTLDEILPAPAAGGTGPSSSGSGGTNGVRFEFNGSIGDSAPQSGFETQNVNDAGGVDAANTREAFSGLAKPVAVDDQVNAIEDGVQVTASVLINDTLPDGADISAFDALSIAGGAVVSLDDGTFTYTPVIDFNGVDRFTYTLTDVNGDTSIGVVNVNVVSVNDAPDFVLAGDVSQLEDAGNQTIAGFASSIFPGALNESNQVLTFSVTTTNDAAFAALPVIDTVTGDLSYTLANDFNGGPLRIDVTLIDDGGTALGGIERASASFNITAVAINDAPEFTLAGNQAVLEDAGAQTVLGFASDISTGPADESGQTLDFSITTSNDAAFSVLPRIDPAIGDLTYTLGNDFNGEPITVEVTLSDDGGTANGGISSSSSSFTITASAVNDAPQFSLAGNQTVLEDAGAQTISGFASGLSAGPANESNQALNFSLSTSNDAAFSVFPSIDPSSGALTYTTADDFNGGPITINVTLTDSGGSANGGDNNASGSFTIDVTPINDAPKFALGGDQSVLEDAGAQTVLGFASDINAGPADESGQTLDLSITTSNDAVFSVLPRIDPATGDLTYTLANDFNDEPITVEVTLSDDGGTNNGGISSSSSSFTISATAVNDAPGFRLVGDQTLLEDAGAQTVSGFASGITAGPANESSQGLGFSITTSNDAAFSELPSINTVSGDLTYTLVDNFNGGPITVDVILRDSGGTSNGGANSHFSSFSISTEEVNDAPLFTLAGDQTIAEDADAQTVSGFASDIAAGPANEAGQVLNFSITTDNPAAFAILPEIDLASGDLSYTFADDYFGSVQVTATLSDDGGVLNAGVDSLTRTFSLEATAVVDVFHGGAGKDNIVATAGDDELYGLGKADTLKALAGNDWVEGDAGNDKLYGDEGNDKLFGGNGNDRIEGGADDDEISGGDGKNTLFGDEGDDTFNVTGTNASFDYVNGGADTDSLISDGTGAVINLRYLNGIEVIDGGRADAYIQGDAGNNTLNVRNSTLTDITYIDGGAGKDKIYGSAQADVIKGGEGKDDLRGFDGSDVLIGGAGNDSLRGGSGQDTLTGGEGNDTLRGDGGNDTFTVTGDNDGYDNFIGGAGTDNIISDGTGDVLTVKAITQVESIDGGRADAYIQGSDANNKLDLRNTTLSNIDRIELGDGKDNFFGTAQTDEVYGDDGNDTLRGYNGNDALYGGDGNDTLNGGNNDDTLYGGVGIDSLIGGKGEDVLFGGDGDDTLKGNGGSDTFAWAAGDTGTDVVADFKGGQGDVINLKDLLAGYTAGDDLDAFIDLNYVAAPKVTSLTIDLDGAGAGTDQQVIEIKNVNWSAYSTDIDGLLGKGWLDVSTDL